MRHAKGFAVVMLFLNPKREKSIDFSYKLLCTEVCNLVLLLRMTNSLPLNLHNNSFAVYNTFIVSVQPVQFLDHR